MGDQYHAKRGDWMTRKKEDTTKYGEFISSFHNWTTGKDFKKRSKELEEPVKPDENKEDKK